MAGKRWGLEGTPVWVLLYTHGHGTDVWVLQTEQRALETAADVIEDQLSEIEEDDPEAAKGVAKALKAKKLLEALREWSDYQGNRSSSEYFEFRKAKLDSKVSAE